MIKKNLLAGVCLALLWGCGETTEDMGDKAFRNNEFQRALFLYHQAYKENPGDAILMDKRDQTMATIWANARAAFLRKDYDQCFKELKPFLEDADLEISDAFALAGFAYLYRSPHDLEQIQKGVQSFNTMLRVNPTAIQVRALQPETMRWLEQLGMENKLVTRGAFVQQDRNYLYRVFLYARIAQIISESQRALWQWPLPKPKNLSASELESWQKLCSLYQWLVHQLYVPEPSDHPRYDALVPDILLRGYASAEEAAVVFVLLTQQLGMESYLISPRSESGEVQGYCALVAMDSPTLFSIKYQEALDQQTISADLQKEFQRQSRPLSSSPLVEILVPGKLWQIVDADQQTFWVRKDGETLRVSAYRNHWFIFDFASGLPLLAASRELANLPQLLQHPSAEPNALPGMAHPFSAQSLTRATLWIVTPPYGIIPRLMVLPMIARYLGISPPPYFSFHLEERLARTQEIFLWPTASATASPYQPTGKSWELAFYPVQIQRWAKYHLQEGYMAEQRKTIEFSFSARLTHLLGQYDQALAAYDQMIKTAQAAGQTQTLSDLYYFRALCLFDKGDLPQAVESFEAYLQQFPQSGWRSAVCFHLGRLYRQSSSAEKAKQYYQQVADTRKAAALFYADQEH